MERDFLGFSSKNGARHTMRVDEANKPKDPVMGSGMQWSFSNKVSGLPHFLSFKITQEERSRNSTISDPLASSGYMTISTKDAFDSNQKPFLGVTQKNLSIGKQAGNNHGMAVYPLQCSDAKSACLQEPRKFPVSNQSNQVSSVLQSNLATTGLSMVNSVIKPLPHGSKSSATPVSVLPSIGSIVGSTDLRNCSKSSATPAQLTIFYGGSVCVYDDISPEKAKAVMLMAGKGSAALQNMSVSKAKLQTEISVPSKNNGFIISQSFPPSSPLPSPLPVTSHASSQSRGGSSGNNELPMIRSAGPSTAPNNHLESHIVVVSAGSAAKKMIQPGGLPQARKASLARFLEKRKERVTSTSPYFKCKTLLPECSTPGSDSVGFSMDFSSSCTRPASASNSP